ncbi:MAG: 30S ribosomal protein S17 [bacterium]
MSEKNKRKIVTGTVTSDKMDKTVTVAIQRLVKHVLYKKYIKRTTTMLAHDEKEECGIGDTVEIKEVRPMSKNKKWLVVKILKKGIGAGDTILDEVGSDKI